MYGCITGPAKMSRITSFKYHIWTQRCAVHGSCSEDPAGSGDDGRADDEFLKLERIRAEQGRRSTLAIQIRCNFSKKARISKAMRLDVHEFGSIEKFFGAPRRTVEEYQYMSLVFICMQVAKYRLVYFFVPSVKSLFVPYFLLIAFSIFNSRCS